MCYSWNASVSIDRLSRHLGLDLLGHVRNLFYMLLLKKCVPSACIAISVLISFPKIVLVLNNSDFHMSPYKHTAVNLFPQTNLNICHCFMIFLKKKIKNPNCSSVFVVQMAYDLDNYSDIWCAHIIEICHNEREMHRSYDLK